MSFCSRYLVGGALPRPYNGMHNHFIKLQFEEVFMDLDKDLAARQEARALAAAAERAQHILADFTQEQLDAIVEAVAKAFAEE